MGGEESEGAGDETERGTNVAKWVASVNLDVALRSVKSLSDVCVCVFMGDWIYSLCEWVCLFLCKCEFLYKTLCICVSHFYVSVDFWLCVCVCVSSMLGHLFKVITNTLALRVKRNKRSLTLTSWLMITSLCWLLVGSEKVLSSSRCRTLTVVSMFWESVRPSVGSPEFISPLPTGRLHFLIFYLLTLRFMHQRCFSASFSSSVLVYLLFGVDLTSFPAVAVVCS